MCMVLCPCIGPEETMLRARARIKTFSSIFRLVVKVYVRDSLRRSTAADRQTAADGIRVSFFIGNLKVLTSLEYYCSGITIQYKQFPFTGGEGRTD